MSEPRTIYNTFPSIIRYIRSHRFTDAIYSVCEEAQKSGRNDIVAKTKSLSENYSYLRRYAINSTPDPSRERQLAKLEADLFKMLDSLLRGSEARNSSNEYYSVLRFEASRPEDSIGVLAGKIEEAKENQERYSLASRLFERTWVTYPLHDESAEALLSLYADDSVDNVIKGLIISSILLGGIHFFDSRRLELLLKIYMVASENDEVATRAVTAAVILMLMHGHRFEKTDKLQILIERCADLKNWDADLKNAYLCVVHTLDTPRINSKILDELVPGLMKLRPEIERDMKEIENLTDLEDLEENPQWADLLEKNGLAEKMRQMSEIQQEGGDVFMSTFAHLKSFPFFYSLSNWFVPFSLNHPALKNITSNELSFKLLKSISTGAFFLCNSDKYSLALSLGNMPEAQLKMMSSQIDMASVANNEEQNSELLPDLFKRSSLIRSYVQDLYRFFNLYSRKDEMINPFASALDLTDSPVLSEQFKPDSDVVKTAAEFCFAHKHYVLALKLFAYMENGGVFTEDLFQKIGFCYNSLNNVTSALEAYRKAELLNGDNPWTLKKLASCLAITGNMQEALTYYERLFDKKQDDPSAIRSYLVTAIKTGNTKLARELLSRLDYYSPSVKNIRLNAMIELEDGNGTLSYDLYSRFLSEGSRHAGPEDYLTHSALAVFTGNYPEALDSLSVARESEIWSRMSTDDFYDKFIEFLKLVSSKLMLTEALPMRMINIIFDSLPRI